MRALTGSFLLLYALTSGTDPPPARASTALEVTYEGLLGNSSIVALVTPMEQRSLWENGRIYTYSRTYTDRTIAGVHAEERWVRTLGGIVGDLGQIVEGEAVLTVGHPAFVFLRPGPLGAFEVCARAQGQFPLALDDTKRLRLVRSHLAHTVPRVQQAPRKARPAARPAPEVLHGRLLDEVSLEVSADWSAIHAK